MSESFKKICVSLLLCFLAGGVGSLFTAASIPTWYATLNKPFFNPPNWIFGPVWTTLYLLMAVSFWKVWLKKIEAKKKEAVFVIFGLQLFLNALWSIVFFGFKDPLLAFVIIVFLWISILRMIVLFYRIERNAGLMQVPYLLWVSFASLLNLSIFLLNW